MAGTGSSPQGRRPASSLIWLVPPVVLALCTATAAYLVPSGARAPTIWCGTVATVVVALTSSEAVRRGRLIQLMRRQHNEREAALHHRLAQQEAETQRLARELLPAAVKMLQSGTTTDEVLREVSPVNLLDPSFAAAHRSVLRSVVEAVQAEEGLRESAHRAFVNIARRVQAIVHQQATDLREMEDRHGNNPDVFGDLLHLDHETALIGRLADSIAVLGGSRPGRQWKNPVPLYNVLRGAMSRIMDYRRVDLHSVADVAVVGPGVEPLIHALAELLDNATRYSPPQTRVHLTAVEVQSGVAVEIEDAGVGLTDEARRRTEAVLEVADRGLDLNDLGETPRLGLAVVSRLAKTYAFRVSLRPSAYGGVRAVLIVPENLVTASATPGGEIARAATLPPPKVRKKPGRPLPDLPFEIPEASRTSGGLPQRRRRAPGLAARGAPPATATAPASGSRRRPSTEPPPQPGMWLSAFTDAVNGEARPGDVGGQISDESSDKEE
ncbi:ATP-binding protein [Streptomyces cinnamoneus]|uniref:histidine kinase n=1 Tax=Streptomyces cinnamoneus TaxID=53446 RepID=A0A2G1XLY7_STRCJ|nr:ATP-binding protein [Streptomyces cinnamoneus]PHQ52247.1 ATP-binding protein [Streptomyces cinnamoneus]PPT12180.1 ATP-binding protein [Streptomyces cinnamoneus]